MKILIAGVGFLAALGCLWLWQAEKAEQKRASQLVSLEESVADLAVLETIMAYTPKTRPSEDKTTSTPATVTEVKAEQKQKQKPKPKPADSEVLLQPILTDHYFLYRPEAIVDYIKVVIDEQRLYAFEQGKLVMTELISTASTGVNLPLENASDYPHNHLGTFSVLSKNKDAYSQEYDCPMPFALGYHGGHFIHQTESKYYHLLGQPASHGCVREGPEIAKWLFEHTPIGTTVEVAPSNARATLEEPWMLKAAG
ncbi:MAG: hypothetical protein CEN92_217 [Candidatus Berkelbacteria bacterium Licking1014_96]|uniref:L,D-TPase catalytic domain-containing protein n=1 Tax=Candidatus Berkelbacteria bacterium Licking1014_96 TaxID=2017149 RepID=A0A554LFN5_9BACT|nr:MAG: hypothetical protein CEN92_217 [Candidatus Berkelbacteria bacterium Licking1014_96]